MNKKKGIAVAVVLLLILLIGGMLAYFTDTDTKDNVFTLGKDIDITLTESNWLTADTDTDGVPDAAEDIHPGTTLAKNPVVVNSDTASQAYVFAEVIVPCYQADCTDPVNATVDTQLFGLNGLLGAGGWTLLEEKEINTATRTKTYVYYYGSAGSCVALQPGDSTPALFTSITFSLNLFDNSIWITANEAKSAIVPPANPGDPVKNPEVKVNAYAIQTDGYTANTPAAIFGLYTSQNS